MQELLVRGLGLFPAYFRDLLALGTGPKQFVSVRLREDGLFERALAFLGISYGAAFVLKAPLYERPLWIELGAGAAFTLMIAAVCGVAIWLAWRGLGGSGPIAETLVITFYYAGVIEFIQLFGAIGFLGAIRATDPGLSVEILDAIRTGQTLTIFTQTERLLSHRGFVAALAVPALSMAVLTGWVVAGWGAYRSQHRLSRVRSVAAFLLWVLLLLPVMALVFLVANALVG